MHKPLEGIRVLEWGTFHAGPGGPAILADMGAEVIKIEQPGIGDPARHAIQYKGINFRWGKDRNIFFECSNRGKKSVTVNIAHDEGKEIVYKLVEKSDVFFTNLRLKTVKKMRMDYNILKGLKSDLIYAYVTPYGPQGLDAGKGAFDFQAQGRSGLMYNMGELGMPPVLAHFGLIDQATAIMASYQIVVALLMRERFGKGQEVNVSLLSTASYLMYINNLTTLLTGREIPRHEQANGDPLRNYYQCKDGKWVIHTQLQRKGKWEEVCELLGHPELLNDTRYDSPEKRLDKSRELVAIFNKAFLTKTCDEWVRLFAKKDLIISPVNTTKETLNDPQMIENEYIVDFDHPEMGKVKILGFPIHFSQADVNNNFLAPRLGEHTDRVLKEVADYSDEEIARFRKNKII
jgi:crotonobetainyl-CoA:carnitine CoA-transferase CaiB-like acyl-CoA transferase